MGIFRLKSWWGFLIARMGIFALNFLATLKETNNNANAILIRDDDHIELWRPVFIIQDLVSTILYNLAGRTSSQVYGVRLLQENVTLVSSVTNIYATTHCGLFLQKFPFDQQSCTFKVGKTKHHIVMTF